MARGRRAAATTTATSNEQHVPAPTIASSADEFDAASLLALQKHVDAASSGPSDTSPHQPSPSTTPHPSQLAPGQLYAAASAASLFSRQNDSAAVASVLANLEAAGESHIHPDLRSLQEQQQQTATSSDQSSYPAPPDTSAMASTVPEEQHRTVSPSQQLASLAAAQVASSGNGHGSMSPKGEQAQAEQASDESPMVTDGRKGPRRELSQTKRAAQNRAAQRAFRQRKEGYIKKLEEQVRMYADMEGQFKLLQSENYSLREYIIHLQSKLLDAKADMPQPPANLNLSVPGGALAIAHGGTNGSDSASTAAANLLANAAAAVAHQQQLKQTPVPVPILPAGIDKQSPLARVAQAVAELNASKEETDVANGGSGERMDTTDDIDRQLQGQNSTPVASM